MSRLGGHALCPRGSPASARDRRRSWPHSYEIIHGTISAGPCASAGRSRPYWSPTGPANAGTGEHKEQVRGGYEALNGNIITEEEKRAIEALERLAKRWPQSLKLVSMAADCT